MRPAVNGLCSAVVPGQRPGTRSWYGSLSWSSSCELLCVAIHVGKSRSARWGGHAICDEMPRPCVKLCQMGASGPDAHWRQMCACEGRMCGASFLVCPRLGAAGQSAAGAARYASRHRCPELAKVESRQRQKWPWVAPRRAWMDNVLHIMRVTPWVGRTKADAPGKGASAWVGLRGDGAGALARCPCVDRQEEKKSLATRACPLAGKYDPWDRGPGVAPR